MTAAALLSRQPRQILNHISKELKLSGRSMSGASNDTALNIHLARSAQRDGNPQLSASEAERAIANLVANRAPDRLPGTDKNLTFVVEDGIRLGTSFGKQRDQWIASLTSLGRQSGVKVKLEVVPGSVKTPSPIAAFFGKLESAKYSVTVTGEKAQVERYFDAYHTKVMDFENVGE